MFKDDLSAKSGCVLGDSDSDDAVGGCVHRGAEFDAEVHAIMLTNTLQNGVLASAKSRADRLLVAQGKPIGRRAQQQLAFEKRVCCGIYRRRWRGCDLVFQFQFQHLNTAQLMLMLNEQGNNARH